MNISNPDRVSCRRPRRKGAMLVLVAVVMTILMVAAAFSVDIASMYLANQQLQVATDAAAKAAVTSLSLGRSQSTARSDATTCAAANKVFGSPVTLVGTRDITLGSVTYTTSGTWAFVASGTPTTAARVSARATIPTFFGPFLGLTTYSTTQNATGAFVRNKICLVIDRSGSMCFDYSGTDFSYPPGTPPSPWNTQNPYSPGSYGHYNYYTPPNPVGSRWFGITSAVTNFLTILTASPVTTQVGLVTFGSSASTDCTFSTSYSPITTRLNALGTDQMIGSTDMGDALQYAINLFNSTDDGTPWNKIIVLFSDGDWNQGPDPHTLIDDCNNAGIVVHTVCLLNNSGNTTMQDLASQTGGQYYYTSDATSLTAAFTALANQIPVILTQ